MEHESKYHEANEHELKYIKSYDIKKSPKFDLKETKVSIFTPIKGYGKIGASSHSKPCPCESHKMRPAYVNSADISKMPAQVRARYTMAKRSAY